MDLDSPITALQGIGPARAKQLAALGIETVYDLIAYFPRTYEDRTKLVCIQDLEVDQPACFEAMVIRGPQTSHIRKGLSLTKLMVADETWFISISPMLQNSSVMVNPTFSTAPSPGIFPTTKCKTPFLSLRTRPVLLHGGSCRFMD